MYGNTGRLGEKALINNIKSTDNAYFLVKNFTNQNFAQNPIEAINYIKNNYEFVGNLEEFEVYYKNVSISNTIKEAK